MPNISLVLIASLFSLIWLLIVCKEYAAYCIHNTISVNEAIKGMVLVQIVVHVVPLIYIFSLHRNAAFVTS